MYAKFQQHLNKEIADIKEAGLYKNERIIVTPQGAEIKVSTGQTVLNFCANNYLGLSNNPKLIAAAKEAMVDPNVLENCGIDSKIYSGFAIGMGIERMTLVKYNINDIRLYFENDLRFLKQFASVI